MYVTDALERNAIIDEVGKVHPIDFLYSFPTGQRLERLENIINARARGEDL